MRKIIDIIENREGLYEGDLRHYFKVLFNDSSVNNPYHNFNHGMYILSVAYEAAKYCGYHEKFGPRRFRALMISAVLHDLGHSSRMFDDNFEVLKTLMLLEENILEEDRDLLPYCRENIELTQYPYANTVVSLGVEILRDADMSPCLNEVWMQEIVFGIAKEQGIEPIQNLIAQVNFLRRLRFYTDWGKEVLAPRVQNRIEEARMLLVILV